MIGEAPGLAGAAALDNAFRLDGMLAVARAIAPEIDWRHGEAEALPFQDDALDAVASQFALMFFQDREKALREMWRVLKPGGRLAVLVWDTLENTPGHAAMTGLLLRLFGAEAAAALEAPYCLGDRHELAALVAEAGIENAEIETRDGVARFPSIAQWVYTDVKGWTLADMIDEAQYRDLAEAAETELAGLTQKDGAVAFPAPAHVVLARKRG